jgi:putative membrane-bound dehydrogenase-like protein
MRRPSRTALALLLLLLTSAALRAQPKVLDDRLVLEQVAREPDIVTPTGIAVDELGRVWVIENHTHQRPKDYKGPPTDRIRILADLDESGKARKITTFAEGFKNSMGLALGADGRVFLATRSELIVLRDEDGKAADQRTIIKLETPGDYPHNGLSGFAFDPQGNVCFGLGENLGAAYKLIGKDGTTLLGGGEGGSIYRCKPDGTGLVRLATGFWNPFHLAFDGFGRLFAVDNDPDERGPCRLVHVIPGGDYGYRFRYGRKGLHPFDSWDGELPGTLPMVAGTGEAPSGLIACESQLMPSDYRGCLLSTSWGDHLIESFRLERRGASFSAQAKTLIQGGDDFRPVGIAMGPQGAIYFSDWVDKSYPVHGKGRVWRIRTKKLPAEGGLRPSAIAKLETAQLKTLLDNSQNQIRLAAGNALASRGQEGKEAIEAVLRFDKEEHPRARIHALWAAARLGKVGEALIQNALNSHEEVVQAEAVRLLGEALPADPSRRNEEFLLDRLKTSSPAVRLQAMLALRRTESLERVIPFLSDADPFLVSAALSVLGVSGQSKLLLPNVSSRNWKLRLGVLLALRKTGDAEGRALLPTFLADSDPEVRRSAIQWVGEEQLREYGKLVAEAASKPPTGRDLLQAMLATEHLLAGGNPAAEPVNEKRLLELQGDAKQPAIFREVALQMLPPEHKAVSARQLREFIESTDAGLRRAAMRTLFMRSDADSQELLRKLAADTNADASIRADAVLGLAQSADSSEESRKLLTLLLDDPWLRSQALRSLRVTAQRPEIARSLLAWWDRLNVSGDEKQEVAAQLLLALKGNESAEVQKQRIGLAKAAGERPADDAVWQAFLARGGDSAAGERVFFHIGGPRCFVCHRVEGRGGSIGPDLSAIGRATSREKLIESVLQPSKEIAPRYVSWNLSLRNGRVLTGLIVDEGPNSTITVADGQGKLTTVQRQEVEERQVLHKSIMPDKLQELMTPSEFRDLIAFLCQRK